MNAEEEISIRLQDMLENVMRIQSMDLPQSKKDEAITIMSSTLDTVVEETSQTTIDTLVYKEYKKAHMPQ